MAAVVQTGAGGGVSTGKARWRGGGIGHRQQKRHHGQIGAPAFRLSTTTKGCGGVVAPPVVAVVSSLGTSRQQLAPALCSFGDPPPAVCQMGGRAPARSQSRRRASALCQSCPPTCPTAGRLASPSCMIRKGLPSGRPPLGRGAFQMPPANLPIRRRSRGVGATAVGWRVAGGGWRCTYDTRGGGGFVCGGRYHQRSACYHQKRPPPARYCTPPNRPPPLGPASTKASAAKKEPDYLLYSGHHKTVVRSVWGQRWTHR